MQNKPPDYLKVKPVVASLGDIPKKNLTLVKETFPLPSERKEIVTRIGEILAKGGVQKVVLSVGNPIRVDRFVSSDTVGPQPDIVPYEDLWMEVRNSTLLEFGKHSHLSEMANLYMAWQMVTDQECKVEAIFCPPKMDIKGWLGLPIKDSLFGASIQYNMEIPEGAVILVGVNSQITIGVRLPVDMPKKGK